MQPTNVAQLIIEQLAFLRADLKMPASIAIARLRDYDAQALSLLAENEKQFFASDYTRRLFLFDKYHVPSALSQQMFLIRARSSAAHHDNDESTLQSIAHQYGDCLQQFMEHVAAAESKTQIQTNQKNQTSRSAGLSQIPSTVISSESGLKTEQAAQRLDEAKRDQEGDQRTSSKVTHSHETDALQVAATNPATSPRVEVPLLRVTVEEIVSREDFQGRPRIVLRCRNVHHVELLLSVWDEQAVALSELWIGASLHVVDAAQRDARHFTTLKKSLVVLEPDILLDVTDVAECFQSRGVQPLLHFLRRFTQSRPSQAMAMGSIVNSCFDEVLHDPLVDFDSMFQRALQSKPLTMLATVSAEDLGLMKAKVQEQVEGLREITKQWASDRLSTEPTFLSPIYGLQGRLDLLIEYDDDLQRKTVVELKSGSAPALNAGVSKATQVGSRALWVNHLAQISCYNLLLDSAFPGRYGDSQILYAKTVEHPLRNAPNDVKWKQQVLECRNRIVALEHLLLERNFRVLNLLCAAELEVPSFMQEDLRALQNMLRAMNKVEQRYMQAFLSFMIREQYTQRNGLDSNARGFAALWTDSLSEKVERMSVLRGLQFNKSESDLPQAHLSFDLQAAEVSPHVFRVGDVVLLRPASTSGHGRLLGQMLKASVRAITQDRVQLSLRNKTTDLRLFDQESSWILESDYIESSMNNVYGWFMRFFRCEERKRKILLGQEPPRQESKPEIVEEGLTPLQNTILNEALACKDYYLLQGPPGTGKTSVMLRSIIKHLLVDESEVLLVAAFTNRAVDEMCKALQKVVPASQLLRMGTRYSTEYKELLFVEQADSCSMEEQREILNSARVIVCTVSFLHANPELFQLCAFTTGIIDEASQIGEAQLIGILAELQRFILIGDEKQLPAVVTQNEQLCVVENTDLASIGVRDLRVSLFERLLERCRIEGWSHAYRMLEQQARMHGTIQNIASELYYHSRLQTLHEWQTNEDSTFGENPEAVESHGFQQDSIALSTGSDAWLSLENARIVFINMPIERRVKRNVQEAQLCAEIVARFAKQLGAAFHNHSIGIISPFRAQVREIETHLTSDVRSLISVDTVERFQGSERDRILFSSSLNSVLQLRSIQSLTKVDGLEVDRKLNVVLTRARQQFILLGNETILRSSVHYQQLIEYILNRGVVLSYEALGD